jgi:hypothetical protein
MARSPSSLPGAFDKTDAQHKALPWLGWTVERRASIFAA